jgi:hypothetical protein
MRPSLPLVDTFALTPFRTVLLPNLFDTLSMINRSAVFRAMIPERSYGYKI